MTEPLQVGVRGVAKRFGPRQVLDGVDLTIRAGRDGGVDRPQRRRQVDAVALHQRLDPLRRGRDPVGPHQLCGGPQPPPRETVTQIRRLFGMIFQDFQLFPHLTAVGNIMEAPVHVLRVPAPRPANGP